MATEIGTRIKRARERKRWSQRQLAAALEVDRKTVDNWENGRTTPRSSIGALEEVLGVSLGGGPEPEPTISERLRREIMTEPGLSDSEREAVIAAVERTLARERGEEVGGHAGGSAGGSQLRPEREPPAS